MYVAMSPQGRIGVTVPERYKISCRLKTLVSSLCQLMPRFEQAASLPWGHGTMMSIEHALSDFVRAASGVKV